MKKRIIALFCALFMLLPLTVACAETQDPNETEASTDEAGVAQTTAPTAETTEEVPQYPIPEAKDLNGFVYRNLIVGNTMWDFIYYAEDGENGNIINDALFRREAFLEETFNCEVEHIVDSKALTTLGNHIGSGLDLCEVMYLTGTDSMSAAQSGYVLDIKDVQGLNLDQPWWDQRIQKEYLIGDHLFTLEGDMNMLDELRSICVVFNKTLYSDYNYNTLYGTPYDLVEQNKWTFDTLMEMIKGVTVDPTDENGLWGMVSEVSAPYYFFLGLGGGDGLGILLGLGQIDGDVDFAVVGSILPAHILGNAVAADIVGIAGELVVPVGSFYGILHIQVIKNKSEEKFEVAI